MSILKCLVCEGEVEVIGILDEYTKKIKCNCCGFENAPKRELQVIRRRSFVKPITG